MKCGPCVLEPVLPRMANSTIRDQLLTYCVRKTGRREIRTEILYVNHAVLRGMSHNIRCRHLNPLTQIPIPWPIFHRPRPGQRTRLAPQYAPDPHQNQSARSCVVS